MYDASPGAAAAWRALFGRVFRDAGVEVEMIDHGAPRPIADLWARENLCCAFMCGWPFARARPRMQALAVPVPTPPRYEGEPRYCSEFLVRAGSGWASLEDTFGARFGWMSMDSQSGFNAPRASLAQYSARDRRTLFSSVAGPLGTPALALEALRGGVVDVVALDGFWLDLLRHHEPGALDDVRSITTTPWTPIPPLVAAPQVSSGVVASLRKVLFHAHERPAYAPLLAATCVERFVAPDPASYAVLEAMAREAVSRGYAAIR